MTLMVAVLYKNRALPLTWIVYKGKKGHTTAERHIEVLELLKAIVPAKTKVVLLGDGEYDTVDMLNWVKNIKKWVYIVRSGSNIILSDEEQAYPFRDLALAKGTKNGVRNVTFTQCDNAPKVTAIAWWGAEYEKPIFLISNSTKKVKKICNCLLYTSPSPRDRG